jgi:hypothetical protein
VHEDFLRTFLELPHGIPSHDTLTRVFAVLPTATLQAVVLPWLQERRGVPGLIRVGFLSSKEYLGCHRALCFSPVALGHGSGTKRPRGNRC